MTEKLKEYRDKRDFDKTSEPKGEIDNKKKDKISKKDKTTKMNNEIQNKKLTNSKSNSKQLIYLIQHHMARSEHYDFRLELEGVLLSWAVPKGPSLDPKDKRMAIHVEDHPLSYATFEGTIPKGSYGGGTVMLWDKGWWEPLEDVKKGDKEGNLKFFLHGERLKGKWVLVRTKYNEKQESWLLIKEQDDYIIENYDISREKTSIQTGRTMEQISNNEKIKPGKITEKSTKNPFNKANVQLAKLVSDFPLSSEWIYELKYDGYRILAFIQNEQIKLITRNNNDYSLHFKDISDSLTDFIKGRSVVLDGEIVISDENGKTDFQALQNYLKNPQNGKLQYVVFDILALDGEDLRDLPLIRRKEKLKDLIKNSPKNIILSEFSDNLKSKDFKLVCAGGYEGIIAKKTDSKYTGTRNGDWVKLKCISRQEFVVGGYTISKKNKNGISSLLLGYFINKTLIYAGRVGSGITDETAKELLEKIKESKSSPFNELVKPNYNETIVWVKAELAVEVQFTEWTKDNLLRNPSFKGIRIDKDINEIVKEDGNTEEKNPISENKNDNSKTLRHNEKIKSKNLTIVKNATTKNEDINHAKNEASIKEKKPNTIEDKDINNKQSLSPNKQIIKNKEIKILKKNIKSKVKNDEIIVEGVQITSPDKLMFTNPKITKLELIKYYQTVSERMLPYLEKRLLSLVNCPKGVIECFYKKHPTNMYKSITVVDLGGDEEKNHEYFYINNLSGLINIIQNNTIEFHIWGSRADKIDSPDLMVFDLDPDVGTSIEKIRAGVKDLKSILDSLGLVSFLKTSGGKGYHIVVPFHSSSDWESFRKFAKNVAELMAEKWPEKYTTNMLKKYRKGKIFIDWVRNTKGATSIAPYCVRARDGARISMPISWNELSKISPNDITMEDAIKRLKKADPWKDFNKVKSMQKLK